MKKNLNLPLLLLLCLGATQVKAQGDTLELQHDATTGKVIFGRFIPRANRTIQNATTFLNAVLQMGTDDSYQLTKQEIDSLGFTHARYQQYYKTVKVDYGEYLLHGKNGLVETINGEFMPVGTPSVVQSLTESQAITKALNYVNAVEYKWQDSASQVFLRQITGDPNATYYPKGELVVTQNLITGATAFRLAWKFTISSLSPDNEQLIYVDAITGDIIGDEPLISDANTPCNAQTKYSGTQAITGDSYTGGYRLQETRNGVTVETLNMQHGFNPISAIDFSNTNTNFISGSWPAFAQDQAALDGQWAAEKVLDFWKTKFNRNSLNGAGLPVFIYVHYGSGYTNSKWKKVGSSGYTAYGDGGGATGPWTSLDFVGHETGHGINQYTANLTDGDDESGALNEGFSDIWGASVEQYAAPAKQTWRIGEDIIVSSSYNCVRDLQNPKSATTFEGPHPDTYNKTYWDKSKKHGGGEPHNNSTILTHWFYLVSQGGTGTNDYGNNYSITGIGMDKAEQIAFRAEQHYLHSSSNYIDARNTTIQAATELYCASSPEVLAVTNAWYAVGVGGAANFVAMSVYGPAFICSTSTYQVPNQPTGVASLVWSSNNTAVATVNNSGLASRVSNGSVIFSVVVTGTSGCVSNVTGSTVTVGAAQVTTSGTPGACSGSTQSWYLAANPATNGTNYHWTVDHLNPNSSITIYNPNSASTNVNVTGGGVVKITYNDGCGNPGNNGFTVYSTCHSLMATYTISPNPSSKTITITAGGRVNAPIINAQSLQGQPVGANNSLSSEPTADGLIAKPTGLPPVEATIKQVKILDSRGRLVKQFNYSTPQRQVKIDVTALNAGIYFVNISDGKLTSNEKLVIQR